MKDLQAKLERLVDGELSRDEYVALLTSLEQQPQAWKDCALMFLEHQALREDLSGSFAEPQIKKAAQPPAVAIAELAPRRRAAWPLAPQIAALAASLALAFFLGRGSLPVAGGPESRGMSTNVAQSQQQEQNSLPSLGSHGRLTLVVNGPDGRPREVELPVVDGERVDPRLVLEEDTAIPPEVLRALQASGHRLESRRELVPLRLDHQREVVVPVDHVRVVPVSRPMF